MRKLTTEEVKQMLTDGDWSGLLPLPEEFDQWLYQHDIELAAKLGWSPFGTHVRYTDPTLVFSENTEDGLPDWERPA